MNFSGDPLLLNDGEFFIVDEDIVYEVPSDNEELPDASDDDSEPAHDGIYEFST